MGYFLSGDAVLKWLETPSVYQIAKDEIYELDDDSFDFLKKCASVNGCDTEDTGFIDYCVKEGILTRDKVPLKRPPVIKSPRPSLRYLELQITDRCNLKCRHCYIGKKGHAELSMDRIRRILKEFEEIQGLRVLITGGEPLLHSKFDELNRMFHEFFFRKVLFTNGILLNKKIVDKLDVDEIQISIDGLKDAHESLRGKGTFMPALDAVKLATDNCFDVSISTMIHAGNIKDFDKMDKLFRGMDIKDWTVDVPCPAGRLKKNIGFQISPEQGGKFMRYGYGGGIHADGSGFACGLHLMAVMADGRVSKCTFYSENPVGRIEEGLKECWKRIKPIRLRNLKCDCDYMESCRGGCRYRAELLGDPLGKDLYRCNFYDIISEK